MRVGIDKEEFDKALEACFMKKNCKGWHGGEGSIACTICDYRGITLSEMINAKKVMEGIL